MGQVKNRPVSDIAFTPAVKRIQEGKGSRQGYARMEEKAGWSSVITADLAAFVAERDSLYLATASAEGQPYAQHRGGAPGFLKVLDEKRLAFADFRGNRQYVSTGNLSENPRAFIFLMDYASRRRIKIWGQARVIDDDQALLESLVDHDYEAVPEQAVVFTVDAWDVNCPQHITPRYSQREVDALLRPLQDRVADLEARLAAAA